jgi:hypothetical protein
LAANEAVNSCIKVDPLVFWFRSIKMPIACH